MLRFHLLMVCVGLGMAAGDAPCEVDMQPGVYLNKVVPGGTYITDTTNIYPTPDACMQACCDLSTDPKLPCNMAYYYTSQDPQSSDPTVLRRICVLWNCAQGACQPNRDPTVLANQPSPPLVGFILPAQSWNTQQSNNPQSQYLPTYQTQQTNAQQSQINSNQPIGDQPMNQYPQNNPAPASQYQNPQVQLPQGQYSNVVNPANQGYQSAELSQNALPPPQSGTLPAQSPAVPGQWVFNPSTQQYEFVPSQPNNLGSNNADIGNAPQNITTQGSTDATTFPMTTGTTGSAGGWNNWWGNLFGSNSNDDKDAEDAWLKEEEEEEAEWEAELEQWEEEMENSSMPYTYSTNPTTTMSEEEEEAWEEEWEKEEEEWEKEEEAEEAEWEKEQSGEVGTQNNIWVDDQQESQGVDESQSTYYKPDTFPVSQESSWIINAPVIAVAACAGTVLILLLMVLIGKKLAGTNDRAQYKPLRESFSGSSTYHEDI